MTTIVIDQALREKLQDLDHEVELRDEDGQTVGRFLPEVECLKLLYDRAKLMLDDKEIEKARNQTGGRPLAEILKELEASVGLGNDKEGGR
jgi:hypothetical protein